MLMLARRPVPQATFDFALKPGPREMPLKANGDGRFTAWRGRSGRRYVVTAYAAQSDEALGFADAVLIAVDRGRQIVEARDSGPWGVEAALEGWRAEVMGQGAVEIHVHLIAPSAEARRRVIADLSPDEI